MNGARKALIMMMLLGTMLNDEYSIEPVDFGSESSQDETEESEDTDEQDD